MKIFYRWHPEVAVRYLPIVTEIRKHGVPSVLEIGSGGLGITPYLGRKVTGLDTKFSPPFYPLLERKTGSATNIPYADKSFDVVIAVDTLEHVPRAKRKQIVTEMIRAARKEVIVAVPTGKKSEDQDKELNEAYKQIYGRPYDFLNEQITLGLPTVEEIKFIMGDNVRTEENEPLALRNFLMRGWMKPGLINKIFYWKVLLLFIPMYKLFNHPPYYRTIFYKSLGPAL